MIHMKQAGPSSAASDDDLDFNSQEGSLKSSRGSGLLYRALKRFADIAFPSNSNDFSERHHYNEGLYKRRTESKPKREARIKSRICLALVIFYSNSSNSLALSLKGSSKRRLRRLPKIAAKTPIWKECRQPGFLLSLGMSQSGDNVSEIPDDQGDNDDYEYQGEDLVKDSDRDLKKLKKEYSKRITRLEDIVSRQAVELHRLKQTCAELSEVSKAFGQLILLLREAGLDVVDEGPKKSSSQENQEIEGGVTTPTKKEIEASLGKVIESYDDALIFGTAPTSVIDAADGAGAAILAAMLGGKQRMLVDVRDAELSSDPEILVQFIELAILPIAAGLEGLKSTRNRVKIVFPKVSQLLEYRRTMALAAPEVVALSTLGFDPVEKRDKLVVIVAPEPDDEEGIQAIRDLLTPSEDGMQPIQQPVVILNYHMLPFTGVDMKFETAYHLRLLTVQYMADLNPEEYVEQMEEVEEASDDEKEILEEVDSFAIESVKASDAEVTDVEDEALESAMKHAHNIGVNEGVTRAMVIRAYPRPWHIFVDLSPTTNADFEVAATFDKEPTMEELNFAIVECLEGSEREDEIVAQQMQQALEDGQLNQVSGMISDSLGKYLEDNDNTDDTSLDDDEDDDFDMFEEDSV